MNQDSNVRDAGQQDLAGIVSRFRRHLPISVAIIAIAVVLAFVATQFMPRKFTATADLSYSPQGAVVRNDQRAEAPVTDAQRSAAVEAQLQLVSSLPVATEVLKSTNVAQDPELRERAAAFGNSSEAMATALLQNVGALRVGQTELFQISYTDANPLKAAQLANAFSTAYLKVQKGQKEEQADATTGQLERRIEVLRQEAEAADAAVAAYRVRNNVLTAPESQTLEQEISTINAQLAAARGAAAGARVRDAQSGNAAVSGGVDTTARSGLQERRAEVARDLAGLTARYGDRNPQVIDARERLSKIDSELSAEAGRVSRGIAAESSASGANAASLQRSLSASQAKLANNVRASVELGELQRKAETARQLYQNLLSTSGQQTANRALIQPDSRLVAEASPPLRPSSPRLLINLLVGFVLGLAIALGIAYLRESWNKTLNTIDDIDRHLGVDFLNSIPTLKSAIDKPKTNDPAEAVVLHPLSSYSESFRNLATTLTFNARSSSKPGGRVIGITSALPREGKTTTSISLARVQAMAGMRVALIDADLRRRSVTQTLAPDVTQGWTDLIEGQLRLEDVMLQDQTGFTLLPIAPKAHEAQRPMESNALIDMISRLREQFEIIFIDTAPVLAVVDTRVILPHLDALVMLAHWRQTPVKAIRAALHQIEAVGGHVDGVAMTMVNLKTQAQSGYGDASYYYDEMKEYYSK